MNGRASGSTRAWLAALVALVVIDGLLLLPLVVRFRDVPLTWVAVEALLLPALFVALPRRTGTRWLASLAASVVGLVVVLGLAEAATWGLLLRPLNLYLDWRLLAFGHDLLVTNLGWPAAIALESAGVSAIVAVVGLVRWLLLTARGAARRRTARWGAGLVACLAAVTVASPTVLSYWPTSFAPGGRLAREQLDRFLASREEMQRFRDELHASTSEPSRLGGLADVDVIIGFIESYGVSVHEDARYADRVEPALAALSDAVSQAELDVVSGRLISPVQGGQSWLAHGSVISGRWLDNQIRYDLMLRSGAPTLIDDFRRTGHRTVGVFPAITGPWPDGERFGYDAVHAAADMDYAGPRLNWVTMPDQYTWDWFQRHVRAPSQRPVFAELALISSHAPWTPVLPVLADWNKLGDGSVFEHWRDAGPAPSELWQDQSKVRQYFARSIRYALEVVAGYTRRHVDDDTLLIILGDHQPAPMITGDGASRAVPVHVISGDDALLRPFRERGFRDGLQPASQPEAPRLSVLRDWLIAAYSE